MAEGSPVDADVVALLGILEELEESLAGQSRVITGLLLWSLKSEDRHGFEPGWHDVEIVRRLVDESGTALSGADTTLERCATEALVALLRASLLVASRIQNHEPVTRAEVLKVAHEVDVPLAVLADEVRELSPAHINQAVGRSPDAGTTRFVIEQTSALLTNVHASSEGESAVRSLPQIIAEPDAISEKLPEQLRILASELLTAVRPWRR